MNEYNQLPGSQMNIDATNVTSASNVQVHTGLHSNMQLGAGQRGASIGTPIGHIKTQHGILPQFSCDYCYGRQGNNGFRRYDDLVQHLRGHHKIETPDKLQRSPAATIGQSQGPLVMQQPQPLFECFFPGCNKCGPNGYLRQIDLDEHQFMMHANLDEILSMEYPSDQHQDMVYPVNADGQQDLMHPIDHPGTGAWSA